MTKDEERLLKEKYAGKKTSEFEADRHRLTQHPVGCPDAGGEPVAYVIGWQPFLGLKIHLDSRPLIPRPETEWWTEEMLRAVSERSGRAQRESPGTFAKGAGHFRFLDLCAGSGAVGCAALARLPEARVYFGELDPAHDATIRKNIRENGLDAARAP
ncbi:MAG: RsmD family RNA methyltransferase [Patescibacteria group bacterium]|nr:RsmD family RNA methyltransferase [Patescibacteria group bacterium]